MIYILTEELMNETAINSDYPITILRQMYNGACAKDQSILVNLDSDFHLRVKYVSNDVLAYHPAEKRYLFTEEAWNEA